MHTGSLVHYEHTVRLSCTRWPGQGGGCGGCVWYTVTLRANSQGHGPDLLVVIGYVLAQRERVVHLHVHLVVVGADSLNEEFQVVIEVLALPHGAATSDKISKSTGG